MATSATTDLRFRLLGPLEVLRGGESLHLGGERQRGLLALLLLHPNELVTTERLVEELFGTEASDSSVRAVRVAVSRLRRLLDEETLVTRPGGYVVYADPSQLDVAEFEALVMEGRSALDEGDPTSAAAAFRAALALFRGPPLADLALLDFVQPEIRRLEELRLSALMDRIDADLALGRGAELAPELEGLVQANPFQERLRGQLMLALYRSGRQSDALEVYRRTRELLADELGLEPSRGLQQLERSILQHDPALDLPERARAAVGPSVCPFKGLAAFEAADAFYFCGRERLLSELIARLASGTFVGIVGPSGVGKSSLLRAGVLPALAAGALPGSASWRVVLVRPGSGIDEALATGDRVVIAVDQLEEVFADDVTPEERTAFLDALERAAADPSRRALVLVTVRADFYGRFADHPRLADRLSQSQVFVRSLDRDDLARAIEVPAGRAGLEVERSLVDALVADTAGAAGALPLLQTTLLQLWTARDGRTLRFDAYRAIGGVRGAVARLAEDTYRELADDDQEIARRVLLRLAAGEDGALVRRRVALEDVLRLDGAQRVVDALVAARLLTVDEGQVEVSHEALIQEWPRYRGWLDDDRVGRRVHAHLTASADDWETRGRDAADLYRGARLSAALELPDAELTEREREFRAASRVEAERELRRQRAHNRRLRALLVGVVVLLAAAVVAGLVALHKSHTASSEARAALAGQLGAEAEVEPRIDRAMLLAREAIRVDRNRDTEGTLLATLVRSPEVLATYALPIDSRPLNVSVSPDGRTVATFDNQKVLRFFSTRTRRQVRTLPSVGSSSMQLAYSPDGTKFATLDFRPKNGPTLDVLDARTDLIERRLRFDHQVLTSATVFQQFLFWRGNDTLYYAYALQKSDGSDGAAFLDRWNLGNGKLDGPIQIGTDGLVVAAPVDRGRRLIVQDDKRISTLQLQSLRRLTSKLVSSPDIVGSLGRVDPNEKTVAIGTLKGSVLFVDVRTGKVTVGAAGHQGDVQSVAMSPDGRLFVSVGDDAKAIVWDARTFAPVETLTGHGGRITGAAFSRDSRTLFTSSLDGTVLEWDVGNTRRFGRPFSYHAGPLAYDPAAPATPALAVAPDGKRFAVDGPNWQAEVLRRSDQRSVLRFGSHVTALAWSPDGRLIATGGDDGRVELFSARTGTLVRVLTGFHRSSAKQSAEAVQAIAFDRTGASIGAVDGTYFAGPSQPFGDVAVWATATGSPVVAPRRFASSPNSIAFSSDGTRLVMALSNGRADVLGLPSGTLMRTIKPTRDGVSSVAFARDDTLVTGTWAGIVQRWNVVSGAQIGHPVLASPAPIASLAFNSAGDTFATTGGSDGTAKLWTTATEQQLGATFQTDPGQWGASQFTSDGKALVVVYGDGTGYVWPVTVSAWSAHACTVAGRNLTREEWQRYVPHRAYARVCT